MRRMPLWVFVYHGSWTLNIYTCISLSFQPVLNAPHLSAHPPGVQVCVCVCTLRLSPEVCQRTWTPWTGVQARGRFAELPDDMGDDTNENKFWWFYSGYERLAIPPPIWLCALLENKILTGVKNGLYFIFPDCFNPFLASMMFSCLKTSWPRHRRWSPKVSYKRWLVIWVNCPTIGRWWCPTFHHTLLNPLTEPWDPALDAPFMDPCSTLLLFYDLGLRYLGI